MKIKKHYHGFVNTVNADNPEYGECKYFEMLNDNLPDNEYNPHFKNPEYCLNCHQNDGMLLC